MKTGSILEVPHGPDIVGRDSGYAGQVVDIQCTGVGTRYDAPLGAVPVLDERVTEGLIGGAGRAFSMAHSPDIIGRESRYPKQGAVVHLWTGAWNNAPLGAIPMLDECR